MNLLIVGAGGHGQVIAEIATDLGFEEIAYLDDNSQNAVGKISEIEKFIGMYEYAFVGIGNNRLRSEIFKRLEHTEYKIPVLIHPTAYVSKTARIGKGTVVEPMAIVNTNTIVGAGSIISVGAIVDHNAVLANFVHVNAGAIVKGGAVVSAYSKIEAGEVVNGF